MQPDDSALRYLAEIAMAGDLPKPAAPGLREAHSEVFGHWLALSAAERILDLRQFLAAHDVDTGGLLQLWLRERYYDDLAPASATPDEIRNFRQAFREALLSLLRGSSSRHTPARPH